MKESLNSPPHLKRIATLPCEVNALAFTSLVRPHLVYASASGDPYTARDTQQLEGVQHRSARFVHKDYRRTISVLSLSATVRPQLVTFVISPANIPPRLVILYKGLHGICPISLDHLRCPTRPTRTLDGLTFIHLPACVDCYKYSFFPRTVIDWNTLPSTTRSLSSVNSFRNSLHQMVFTGHPSYETPVMTHWQQGVRTHRRSTTEELKISEKQAC